MISTISNQPMQSKTNFKSATIQLNRGIFKNTKKPIKVGHEQELSGLATLKSNAKQYYHSFADKINKEHHFSTEGGSFVTVSPKQIVHQSIDGDITTIKKAVHKNPKAQEQKTLFNETVNAFMQKINPKNHF